MKKRFTETQIIGFLKEAESGVPVKELCCRHGFSDASLYTWRSKYGGMDVSEAKRLKELEQERRRFGYRRIHALLRREGHEVNHKRVNRLYSEANLAVKRCQDRHAAIVPRESLSLPTQANEVWSMDFAIDALSTGRRIKILTVVDDCTKESVDLVADFGISGEYVTRILDQVDRFRGYLKVIRTDQGLEFTGRALDQWAY